MEIKTTLLNNRSAFYMQNQLVSLFSNAGIRTILATVLILFGFTTEAFSQAPVTYTSNGTFVVPNGVTSVQVEAWGGGGAGGGGNGTFFGGTRSGGGGAGGSYNMNTSFTVTPGQTINVTIGQGGSASNANNGGGGGASSFGAFTAAGGGGGVVGSSSDSTGAGGAPGAAGTFAGGAGATAPASGTSGGGGGGAGSGGAGAAASGQTGGGGGIGAIPGGVGATGRTSTGSGAAATALAAGGAGGRTTGNTDVSGGNGFRGQVIVTYTCPVYALTDATTATGPFCGSQPSVVTLASSTLASGTYTITYDLSGATTVTGATASVVFTSGTPGTGTFSTSALNIGTTDITITNIQSATCNSAQSINNTASVVVSQDYSVSVSISGTTTVCEGTNVTFTATPTNGGPTPSYQWQVNGGNVGTDSPSYDAVLNDNDVVTVILTTSIIDPCILNNPATSNALTMDVYPILPASVSISTATTEVCAESNVTFTATPTNGGNASYQWKVNGGNAGTNSPTFSTTTLANGDNVMVTMTSATPCLTGLPADSETITMTVNPILTASISITASATSVCPGEEITFDAMINNGGPNPVYQWKVNGGDVGTNSPTFTTSTVTPGNYTITAVLTSDASPCLAGSPATSNAIIVTVNPNPTAVTITPAAPTVCEDAVTNLVATGGTFTATALSENFNAATNNWTTENTSTNATPADAAWKLRPSPYSYATFGNFSSNDASQFYLSNSDDQGNNGNTSTRLVSPVFSLAGYTAASLNFYHYYRDYNGNDNARVQISTDGGSTWSNLVNYTTTQGAINNFASVNLDLTPYVGQTNLNIRFHYVAIWGYFWAVDNVTISGSKNSVTWTPQADLYTDAAGTIPYTGSVTSSVYAKISADATYTATSTTASGCISSQTVSLTVTPKPTLASTAQATTVCENSSATIDLTGLLANSTSTISYNINGGATQNATSVVADASGNASFAAPVILADNGQTLTITNIQRTDFAVSCDMIPSSGNTAVLSVNQNVTYYADVDEDGFGDPAATQVSCFGAPVGYVSNNSDCNDNQLQYLDADGDGFGSTTLVACGVTNNTDCDDNLLMYSDADSDGFGALPYVDCNGLTNNADCNDNQLQYLDADGDGFGSSTEVACGVTNNIDCDDNVLNYADNDGDGFGSATYVNCGGSLNNTDCNDNQLNYSDVDGDGFGALPYLNCGGVTNGTDCNDNELQYLDADNDGFGSTTVVDCGVADNSDCNDNDGSMHTTFAFYADGDGDTYGAGDPVSGVCAVDAQTAPAGYSVNNSDCDDSDSGIYQSGTLYVDADNDGYTNGDTAVVCYGANAPSGYALTNIGLDCNDSAAQINPGMTEVLYNGIDDNCDGNLDEGNQITTQIIASQCGTTLPAIGSNISAVSIPQATGYRFEVTNTLTNAVQFIEKPVQFFSLTQLASYDYETTYSVRVMLQRNGVWLGYYGSACLISSPAVTQPGGAAQVTPSQCGITLPSINTLIATTSTPGVTSYRFRVTNISDPSAPNQVQQIDRSLHWFNLPMLATYNYGTTYIIEVALKTNGAYSPFGNACQISSPAVPSISPCGGTIAQANTYISTASLAKVTSYRFEITNLVSNQVTTLDRSQNWFTFNMVPGYSPATLYGVRVAIMSAGHYSLFSDACEITSPGTARPEGPKAEVTAKTAFAAVAYPNPFANNFMIDVKTASESEIGIKVYDMTGRILEVRNIDAAQIESQQIGDSYPAGVYNVILSQGTDVKTLRVVKR